VSATSRQPLSMVSECPRSGIATISVTPTFRFSRLNAAFATFHGTVLSFSPEMINSGPRFGLSMSTFASVHGLKFGGRGLKDGRARRRTVMVEYTGQFCSLTSVVPLASERRYSFFVRL